MGTEEGPGKCSSLFRVQEVAFTVLSVGVSVPTDVTRWCLWLHPFAAVRGLAAWRWATMGLGFGWFGSSSFVPRVPLVPAQIGMIGEDRLFTLHRLLPSFRFLSLS